MDRGATSGHFYKKLGLDREKLFGDPERRMLHPLLARDVEQKFASFSKGSIVPVVFEALLKDEIRPLKKVLSGSTRMVDPMDLSSLIVQRMVLGTFIEECMKDPVNSPVALAINPHSSQWGALYERHRGDLERLVAAGDFVTFDYTVKNEIKDDFIRLVRANHPFPDLAERIIEANFLGWHLCGSLLFFRAWGTCSGSLITSLFNCFANWWVHKSAFLTVYSEEDWLSVFTSFVGDDSIFSNPPTLDRYNMQLVHSYCRDVLSMTYTSPAKDDSLFVSWDSLQFLKRTFVQSSFGCLAPLAASSMSNMVKWCECDPKDQQVMKSTMESLLLECWHYGREIYDSTYSWCNAQKRLCNFSYQLPDWQSMVSLRKGSYSVGMCMLYRFVSSLRSVRSPFPANVLPLVAAANRLSQRLFGVHFTTGTFAPLLEEFCRSIFPDFTENIIEFETAALRPLFQLLGPDLGAPYIKVRDDANNFHAILGYLAVKHGWASYPLRVKMHSGWNRLVGEAVRTNIPPDTDGMLTSYRQLATAFCCALPQPVYGKTLNYPREKLQTCELEDSCDRGPRVNRMAPVLEKTQNYLSHLFDRGDVIFNTITENKITQVTAVNGMQADSQQMLTQPVETALYVTPTMMFGDVGSIAEQETGGYSDRAHGVGEFEDANLLERMVALPVVNWTVGDATIPIASINVVDLLKNYARNSAILSLYQFYRTDVEVTIKLNTNQFYAGALMLTLIPSVKTTGEFLAERAVMDPTVISASSAESVVKTWNWSWPYPWRGLWGQDVDGSAQFHELILAIDSIFPLTVAQEGMPSVLSIQIWARFKNMRLMYPFEIPSSLDRRRARPYGHVFREGRKLLAQDGEKETEAQSGVPRPKTAVPRSRPVQHPSQDPGSSLGSLATELVDTVTSVPAQIVDGAVGAISGIIDTGLGSLLGAFLDKPDQVDEPGCMIIEQSKDLFACDIPDSNVCVSLNKARYVDPSVDRMPLTKNWTLLEYAKIPGLLLLTTFSAATTVVSFSPIQQFTNANGLRTPLDYACMCSLLQRGSIRMMLQFFTSSFVSARFSVQLMRNDTDLPGFDDDYSYGLSKVVNVKGDTVDYITLPWLDPAWWSAADQRAIQISLISDIATTDTTTTPKIYMAVWVAAGDDFQFQFPVVPTATRWPGVNITDIEAQASIGKMFQAEFPPIVDNVVYDTDEGFSSGETIGYMTDVAKRYSPFNQVTGNTGLNPLLFNANILDSHPNYAATTDYALSVGIRSTFFGAMRECFLFRSGGYRYRRYPVQVGSVVYTVNDAQGNPLPETIYCQPFDGTSRITVPQVSTRPYVMFDDWSQAPGGMPQACLSLNGNVVSTATNVYYLAARDDVQFGYPILPTGVPAVFAGLGRSNLTSTRGKFDKRS
jgi:hypothetical protein